MDQDINAAAAYLNQFNGTTTPFLDIVTDFHFLLFLATNPIVALKEVMGPLIEAIRSNDHVKANEWKQSNEWSTVIKPFC